MGIPGLPAAQVGIANFYVFCSKDDIKMQQLCTASCQLRDTLAQSDRRCKNANTLNPAVVTPLAEVPAASVSATLSLV